MTKDKSPLNSSGSLKGRARYIVGLLISLVCILWVFSTVEVSGIIEKLRAVDQVPLSLAVLTTIASYFLRAYRWPYFFGKKRPSFLISYRCMIVGFFMNNVLPARIGELVRAHIGGVESKNSRSFVLATIAGERLADGLAISLLFAVLFSFFAEPHLQKQAHALFVVAYFFAAAGLGTVILLLLREQVFGVFEKIAKVAPWHFVRYVLLRARRFIEGLEPLLEIKTVCKLTILSALVWSVELMAYHFVAVAFHHPMGLGSLSLFLAAVNFSSLIPSGPGAIGVIEAFATAALVSIGFDHETALVMVAVQHLIQFLVVGIPGLYFFLFHLGGKIRSQGKIGDSGVHILDIPST